MAGIYIHIPFCKQACNYCNFHFSTATKSMDAMIRAIIKEATLRSNYLKDAVATIYFGGGTPSLLSIDELKLLIDALNQSLKINRDVEITLEANPDDITEEKLKQWKALGINRLSIGIQSFFEEDLQWMNRAHNASQAMDSLKLALQYFNNITIDLIYGSPTLTDEQWLHNINTAISLNIPHLSCYALTVEPKTALDKLIKDHKLPNVDADKQARHFDILVKKLQLAGYDHYEISNFAKPGFRSKHNSSYWQGKNYLGLGPSAHSFNGISRQWNIANNALYIKSIEQDFIPFEMEELTKTQQLNEYIMTSLRTMEGLSLQYVEDVFGANKKEIILQQIANHIALEQVRLTNNTLILTEKGRFFADGIAADLFQ